MGNILDHDEQASLILDNLEDLGMLPPLVKVELLPDPNRLGKVMHSGSRRGWDEGEDSDGKG
jgi:hypothetical protein